MHTQVNINILLILEFLNLGADCEVLVKDKVFEGLFFVTAQMKNVMEAFPEFVGIDATYKLLDLRAPLYLAVVENSQGQTEIVASCILMHETKDNLQWFMDSFKEKHPSWPKIKTVMADKDLTERDVVKQSFPQAKVLICLFHTQRTFNREITTEKLGITNGQKDTSKRIIQKMIYCNTEDEYSQLYDELKTTAPKSVIEYFNKNWHDIRHDWSFCGDFIASTFLNTTNNRLESINGKIKSVVSRFKSLENFIMEFFILITTRETEHDAIAAYSCLKRRAVPFRSGSPEEFFNSYLTHYAFKFVQEELQQRSIYKIAGVSPENGLYIVSRENGRTSRETNETKCDCNNHLSMGLPCRYLILYNYLHYSLFSS